MKFGIRKLIEDERLVFGWANVAADARGEQVLDHQQDMVEIAELERAVYEYVEDSRDAGEMHWRGGVGTLVESVVFTKEKMAGMGLGGGLLPEGWWIGVRITDDEVWAKVKDGTYRMFSIEGTAVRERV